MAFVSIIMACLGSDNQQISKSTHKGHLMIFLKNSNLDCLCRLTMCYNGRGELCQGLIPLDDRFAII